MTSIESALLELRGLVVAFADEQQSFRDRIFKAEGELASLRPRVNRLEGNGAST